jgi:predicted HicB family RNase H-like nuclease
MTTTVVITPNGVKWYLTAHEGTSTLGAKMKPTSELTVLNLRGMPKDVVAKLKAAAALQQKSLTAYVSDLLKNHVQELEKKGLLPKGK